MKMNHIFYVSSRNDIDFDQPACIHVSIRVYAIHGNESTPRYLFAKCFNFTLTGRMYRLICIYVFHIWDMPCEKYLEAYAHREGPDQTAQLCSLIRALTVCSKNHQLL